MRKPSLKRILAKYSRRERNRAKDFVHKLTTSLSRKYRGYIHGFEDLRKERMFNKSKNISGKLRRAIGKSYSLLCHISRGLCSSTLRDTSKGCSRCGKINAPKGAYECGLRIDRQLNAALNLQMETFSELFEELMRARSGFTLTGGR
ncbi:MAG: hypothetical protein QXO55_06385 [Candidatus Korarchaeum sp.]